MDQEFSTTGSEANWERFYRLAARVHFLHHDDARYELSPHVWIQLLSKLAATGHRHPLPNVRSLRWRTKSDETTLQLSAVISPALKSLELECAGPHFVVASSTLSILATAGVQLREFQFNGNPNSHPADTLDGALEKVLAAQPQLKSIGIGNFSRDWSLTPDVFAAIRLHCTALQELEVSIPNGISFHDLCAGISSLTNVQMS